jgi:hypothetical protein
MVDERYMRPGDSAALMIAARDEMMATSRRRVRSGDRLSTLPLAFSIEI